MFAQPLGDEVGGRAHRALDDDLADLQLHDPGIDGGQVEDIVHDRLQLEGRRGDVVDVIPLPWIERSGRLLRQQFGEPADARQRRTQFIGDMTDEVVLELVRTLERLVLVLEHALDIHAVRHIYEGRHHLSVRQVDDREAQHIAVIELDLAVAVLAVLVEAGHRGGKLAPGARLGKRLARSADHRDMRSSLHQPLGHAPQVGESGVGQPNAPIRAKHRDTFGEIVERDALDAHDRVVAAFKIDLLGEVLEHPGNAAVRLRIGDDTQRPAVGQVPQMLLRLDRAIGAEQVLLPAAPFGLLGKLAVAAQPVEQKRVVRLAFEEGQIELPELLEGLVEEAQLLVRIEDRDRSVELVECIRMAANRPLMLLADRFDLADIACQPGGSFAVGRIRDREDAPVAADHGRQALREDGRRKVIARDLLTRAGSEEFAALVDGRRGVCSLHRPRIGGIHPLQPAVAPAQPGRHRERIQKLQDRSVLAAQLLMFDAQFRMFAPRIGKRKETYCDMAGGDASLYLQERSLVGLDDEIEGLFFLPQGGDRALEPGGTARCEPFAESQKRSAVLGRIRAGEGADQFRFPFVAEPDEDALILQIQQCLGTLKRIADFGDPLAQPHVFGSGAGTFAYQQDRGQDRSTSNAREQGELDNVHGADGNLGRDLDRIFLRVRRG